MAGREKVIVRYSHGKLSRQRKPRPLIDRLFLIAVKSHERMQALALRCDATEDLLASAPWLLLTCSARSTRRTSGRSLPLARIIASVWLMGWSWTRPRPSS